jgi:hypothetical protein
MFAGTESGHSMSPGPEYFPTIVLTGEHAPKFDAFRFSKPPYSEAGWSIVGNLDGGHPQPGRDEK